ncbi:MAG TPA: hypothetical protein VF629_20570 [Hymenobacter sp.]|uniref:hypothetical protein n=1 Tax=Hymenobacter sp. TaxID=1898978 RepID=UPI002ED98817
MSALIISGKLTKQAAPVAVAQTVETTTIPDTSVVFVHHMLPNETVKPVRQQSQTRQSNPSFVSQMF